MIRLCGQRRLPHTPANLSLIHVAYTQADGGNQPHRSALWPAHPHMSAHRKQEAQVRPGTVLITDLKSPQTASALPSSSLFPQTVWVRAHGESMMGGGCLGRWLVCTLKTKAGCGPGPGGQEPGSKSGRAGPGGAVSVSCSGDGMEGGLPGFSLRQF